MTRTRLIILGAAIVVVLGAWWVRGLENAKAPVEVLEAHSSNDRSGSGTASKDRASSSRGGRTWTPPQRLDGAVTIAGTVIDIQSSKPVGNVEVVFRSPAGEETAMASDDGTYRIDVPAGVYRAFVRDELVLSVGTIDHVRLPGAPTADTAGVPDEALMPTVTASSDADGVDLSVMRGGAVTGRVLDRAGRPVKHAVLRARGHHGVKPTLGTDVAESNADGTYELLLPAGEYQLEATHSYYAGVLEAPQLSITGGDRITADITLTAGCVIAGRVLGTGGPAGDGAIEKQWGSGDQEFSPTGKIASDGSFRWVTTDESDITLRAWPWKSPPSQTRRFTCRDGARFDDVVFQLPDRRPDIEGMLVDASGAPVPFAFIDLAPLDAGGINQQERTDAEGKWGVYQMPVGRYHVTGHAPGRGVVSTTVNSPQTGIRLALGGTGRLEGTTVLLENGSFELRIVACSDDISAVAIPEDRRLVTVTGGRFKLDDVPACDLQLISSWRGHHVQSRVVVPANGTARLELPIGPPRAKQVSGVVRDAAGRAVEGAHVIAMYDGDPDVGETTTVTDASGRYTIGTFSGANLVASRAGQTGFGVVGMANVATEQVDVVLQDYAEDEPHEMPEPQIE